jgi:8-oxo-dGTP pyrophosphatase MutT (NUDIX family)
MSVNPLQTDPRFWILSEALASYASDHDDPPIRDEDRVQAAVSLVLRGKENLEVLLIKRARSERDPWSGHMAFPGGRRDDTDAEMVDTAVRETLEETGVDLAADGARLGDLDTVSPSSVRLPRLTIYPFVFGVLHDATARVASREVDRVLWVSLDHLRSPGVHGNVEIELPGGTRSFPCFHVEGEVVWGLTYRIMSQFLERYPDQKLDPAP